MKQGERVFLNDNGETTAKNGDTIKLFNCVECKEYVIAKEIYTNQNVVCPFCKSKFKIKIFKNGRIDVTRR